MHTNRFMKLCFRFSRKPNTSDRTQELVLQLIDQRNSAAQHNLQYEYARLEKEVRKEANTARDSFVKDQVVLQKLYS